MELSSIDTSKWYEGLADGAELYCGGVFLGCKGREYPAKLTVRPGTKMVRIEDYLDGVNELSLPDGLESLIITPEGVSDECGITALTVPESVDYIELRNMSNLTNITLPETAVLAEGCFSGCYQIEDLAIPKGNQTLYGVCVGRTAHVVPARRRAGGARLDLQRRPLPLQHRERQLQPEVDRPWQRPGPHGRGAQRLRRARARHAARFP